MAFPRLQELAAAQNSNSLTDAMSVYTERKINEDLHYTAELSHLWEIWMIPVRDDDPRLKSKKSAMDMSFTLGSTEEADNVKILQSCNGLFLCDGLGLPVFYYVYNLSTNQYKKLPYPDCSLDNSPYYSSAGLRISFDPTKSLH
ncbi:hypothetical protein Tco_1416800 [Tanacetum coccineum]